MMRSDPSVSLTALVPCDAPRIVLFVKGTGPGGVERIAWRLAAGWRTAGLHVDVLSATAVGAFGQQSAQNQALRPWPLIGTRWPMARLAWSLWRHCRREPTALIFCPGNSYTIVAVILKLVLGRHCPPILAKVSNDLRRQDLPRAVRGLYRWWLLVQGRMIDHFAVLSPSMADETQAMMQIPAHRVHLVPNPVLDRAVLHPTPGEGAFKGTGRRFVAVGRLERQKDYPLLLRAFAAGAMTDDRLTIYGEGSEAAALRALAASLGIIGQVRFAGYRADIGNALRQHDILLLSSRYEGLPGVVVEALSFGLDVISTRCCAAMAELLDDGALGTLVEPGDVDGLAKAIANAKPGHQDRGRAMAKAGAFTIEAAVPAYAGLFAMMRAERTLRQDAPSLSRPATCARPV